MRAASVRLNDVSGVSGFVQPNDSVDVLITRQLQGSDTQATDVLLQNVRVLAIDQQATSPDGSAKVAKTATLMVSPIDAQKLALAQTIGSLSLVLRKPGEQDNPVVETVSMNDLRYNIYGGASFGSGLPNGIASAMNGTAAQVTDASAPAAPKPAVKPRKRGPAPKSIEVYRGTKSDEVKVGGYGR
jgi:pilus assembly protein CpaB